MTVHILGNGGHGRDLADIVKAAGAVPAMHDDDPERGGPVPVDVSFLIGVANPQTRFNLDRAGNTPYSVHHPSVIGHASCGFGAVIGAGTTIGPGVTLGRHTHIGAGCTLTRTTIGDYCQVAPGVDIAGDVTIGDRVFVGVGATIRNLVTIGDDAVIGAGSVVLHDVPAGATVVGIPAKVIRRKRSTTPFDGWNESTKFGDDPWYYQ
jgi:acetyltransferase-like isoleucine patch superfamily enzyme